MHFLDLTTGHTPAQAAVLRTTAVVCAAVADAAARHSHTSSLATEYTQDCHPCPALPSIASLSATCLQQLPNLHLTYQVYINSLATCEYLQ